LESQNALTVDKQLELFGQAIEQEKQAIAMQAEAIENHKQACRIWRMQVTDRNVTGIPKARLRQSEISNSASIGESDLCLSDQPNHFIN
jgi:hypothetical protein